MKIFNLHISQISSAKNIEKRTPVFKSSSRSVFNDKFVLLYNTNTCFFRPDLEWEKFVDFINKKYKHTDKVNIIDYACSTGEEAVSLSMMLDLKLGDNAKKFYPILAFDIDEDNIKRAKNGVFDINRDELNFLRKHIGEEYKKYFICRIDKDESQGKLRLIEDYKKNFIYKKSDITADVDKIPSKNTVLLCRNIFPYLKNGEHNIVKQIAKKLNSSSVVVLGKFDMDYGIDKEFIKEGFRKTAQDNVLEKMSAYKILAAKIAHKFGLK